MNCTDAINRRSYPRRRIDRRKGKSRVPPVIYESCSSRRLSFLSVSHAFISSRRRLPLAPPPSLHTAAVRPRRHHSPPPACTPSRRRRALALAQRRPCAPALPPALATAVRRHSKSPPRTLALTQRHPRAQQPTQQRRLHFSTPQSHPQHPSPSARQVLDVLPEPLFSRRVRVPHTASRDGSRKEKGQGSRGREARSQADSRREGGREGRDGG